MKRFVIGIDLGGTNIRSAAVDEDGAILARDKRSTEVGNGKEAVITNILNSIKEVKKRSYDGKLSGIGIGVPGVIFFEKGIVSQSPNFPDWRDFNLKERLEKDIHLPFFIENDANAAAVGEWWKGAGKGVSSFCMLTLGTGIGGGIMLNNKIWHGEDGMGGELGHIIIEPDGHPCGCGGRGCLEQYASANAIVRMAIDAFFSSEASMLREICKDNHDNISSEILYNLAEGGDYMAKDIFKKMGRYLGIGIVSLIHIFNMEAAIIGGGVADAWKYFIEQAKAEIKNRAYRAPGQKVKIEKALCGDDAGILGAAYMAFKGTYSLTSS